MGALGLSFDAVFWFKDLDSNLCKSALVRRELRGGVEKFCNSRAVLVISGHSVELPE